MPCRRYSRPRLCRLESRLAPSTFTVLNTADSGAGSLRQAIIDTNKASGADIIVFDSTIFAAAQTITLTTGVLALSDPLSIVGPTAKLTIDANNASRLFTIDVLGKSSQAFSISNLALTRGNPGAFGGGGIFDNDEALSLNNVSITNCTTSGGGGAILLALPGSSLTMNDCTLSGNSATGTQSSGGAIHLHAPVSVSLDRCTISGNVAGWAGGGIYFFAGGANLTLTNSTLSGNRANVSDSTYGGGAIFLFRSTATIRNCTLSGNRAIAGGAIRQEGGTSALTVQNTTIAYNTAGAAGGGVSCLAGTATFESTILGNNVATSGADFSGSATANSSLFSSTTGSTIFGSNNKLNLDPLLAPLAANGGPTLTHLPQLGSPCFNAGSNIAILAYDQRGPGYVRMSGSQIDIGAVEIVANIPEAVAFSPNVTIAAGTTQPITVTYYDDSGIDITTVGTGDINVTGPNGFAAIPTFVSLDFNSNGSPRTASFVFTPPAGSWDCLDSGTYQVNMVAGQVFEIGSTSPYSVPPGALTNFVVSIPGMFVVTNTSDSGTGSLRQAITDANANIVTANSISFDPTVFATAKTIKLLGTELLIGSMVTITGPAAPLTINGNSLSRIFEIDVPGQSGTAITISGLNLTSGYSTSSGGAIFDYGESLTLTNVAISNCTSAANGGAIFASAVGGSLSLDRCTFTGNVATGTYSYGGAIWFDGGGRFDLAECTLSGNTSKYIGGALYLSNSVTTIRNCTFSSNTASAFGGAIYAGSAGAALNIQNSTIAYNAATSSASLGGGILCGSAKVTMDSTIVAKNTAWKAPDYYNGVTANYCLFGSTANATIKGSNNILNVDPLLAPLADHGGPTKTLSLMAGSPAINAGSNPSGLLYDQRGFKRVFGTAADIGAYELGYPTVTSIVVNDNSKQRSMVTKLVVSFSEAVTFPNGIDAAFLLSRTGPDSNVGAVNLTAVQSGLIVTLTFASGGVVNIETSGSLIDGTYRLKILADSIQGSNGKLDGNGDFTPGDDYQTPTTSPSRLFRLFGDADGDGTVNSTDFTAFRNAFYYGPSAIFDFDGDGQVKQSDYFAFRSRYGVTI